MSIATTPEEIRHVRLELGVALCLTIARIFFGTALLFGLLASYSVWGSPGSPLGLLVIPALVLLMLWMVLLGVKTILLRRLVRHQNRAIPLPGFFDSLSSTSVRRFNPEEDDHDDD